MFCVCITFIPRACRGKITQELVMDGLSTCGYWEQNLDRLEEQRVSLITEIFLLIIFMGGTCVAYMCRSQGIRTGCLFLPVCAFWGWNSGPQACIHTELSISLAQMLSKVDWWGNVSMIKWQLDQLDNWTNEENIEEIACFYCGWSVQSDRWGAWQEIKEIGKILSVDLCGHEIHGFIHRALWSKEIRR